MLLMTRRLESSRCITVAFLPSCGVCLFLEPPTSDRVQRTMKSFSKVAVEIWQSRLGRTLFFIHLVACMTAVGYFWTVPDAFMSPYLAISRNCFLFLNWPAIISINLFIPQIGRSGSSHSGDALIVILCSTYWWLYGYGAEVGAHYLRSKLKR